MLGTDERWIWLLRASCFTMHAFGRLMESSLKHDRTFSVLFGHNWTNSLARTLLAAHRTATLRRDDECQATLVNLLLRNYLHYNLVDQADKLVSKTTFPDVANNNQVARYMYYLGVIKAIQLDYTAAHQHLQQAIRKGPQNAMAAGFQQAIHKMSIIVTLLTGDIPDRAIFSQPYLQKSLEPYLHLTQAVRVGDLSIFGEVLNTYGKVFRADHTYTLILR